MISPTISDSPFRYVSVLCFSSEPPPPAPPAALPAADDGAPSGAYPPAATPVVLDRGKRFEANSKVEDTEKERAWLSGRERVAAAGLAPSRGSSRSREARRDEERLGRESVSSVVAAPGLELASEASSSESRAEGGRLA